MVNGLVYALISVVVVLIAVLIVLVIMLTAMLLDAYITAKNLAKLKHETAIFVHPYYDGNTLELDKWFVDKHSGEIKRVLTDTGWVRLK